MAFKIEVVLGILIAGLLFCQQADPTLAQGVALLQSGDAAGAVNVLKAVTSREPRNGRAWRNLGVAYQQAKDPESAIAAFQRSLEVQPEMTAPLYNIALIYAAKLDADHAFEWLGKAKATRKIDMRQAEATPELAPFRSDPAQSSGLRRSVCGTGEDHPRMGWGGKQRPVRLDRSQHR